MCLVIKKPTNSTQEVYKVYRLYHAHTNGSYQLQALYQKDKYPEIRLGSVIKSDRKSKALTKDEKFSSKVDNGIHVFTRYEDAISLANSQAFNNGGCSKYIVVRLTGKKEDLVAKGTWSNGTTTDGAVYMQLTVSKFIESFDGKNRKVLS